MYLLQVRTRRNVAYNYSLAKIITNALSLNGLASKLHKELIYKLNQCKLKNRNAIRILQINGYQEDLINEANEISKKLDKITLANNTRHSQ